VRRETLCLRIGWICLLVVGAGILTFGLVAVAVPASGNQKLLVADGVASIGLGLFGVLIAVIPFRRRERWAWFALWFYPAFWMVHLVGRLPPGRDHVHQIAFIMLSLAGLLVPIRLFFARGG